MSRCRSRRLSGSTNCGDIAAARIASRFWADSEAEVDRIGEIVRAAGACLMEGPEYCHEYTPGYYAVFFEDEDGNKWEVCCRMAPVRDATPAPN